MDLSPGEVFRHDRFYLDRGTGSFQRKHLLILAAPPDRDLVVRTLTSRAHGRRENPPCFHGDPYAGFFLGVPGGPLPLKTWVDLRAQDDLDVDEFHRLQRQGIVSMEMRLTSALTKAVLECVAGAQDTTRQQEQMIRDALAALP